LSNASISAGVLAEAAEPLHLGETGRQRFALFFRTEKIEFLRTRQRLKPACFLQPPHQPAFLIDEHHRARRQAGVGREGLRIGSARPQVLPGLSALRKAHPGHRITRPDPFL